MSDLRAAIAADVEVLLRVAGPSAREQAAAHAARISLLMHRMADARMSPAEALRQAATHLDACRAALEQVWAEQVGDDDATA